MMLVRQYIHKRLWDYFAQPASSVVGSITATHHGSSSSSSSSIPFSRLWGEWHWKHVYGRLYRQSSSGQWLTPCELFAPYYSQSIANYILKRHNELSSSNSTPRLCMVELGGGRGTHALAVLDHLERVAPAALYETCTYTLLEASPTLHAAQVAVARQSRHCEKLSAHLVDLYNVAMSTTTTTTTDPEADIFGLLSAAIQSDNGTNNTTDPCHVVVMGLEVLDNLPHDKIRISRRQHAAGTAASLGMSLEQAELVPLDGTSRTSDNAPYCWQEVFAPLSDPLLQQVLRHYPTHLVSPRTQTVWIPTVACGVLDALARTCRSSSRNCAHATILLADFDSFGTTSSKSSSSSAILAESEEGTPIVTDMHDVDHPSYLTMTSTPTDILFPTHFARLALYCESLWDAVTVRASASSTSATDTKVVGHEQRNSGHHQSTDTTSAVRIELLRQADFLSRHGPEQVAATSSWLTGYSPMIHDFVNCSVLTISVNQPGE
jgi:Putative S-adenosyl-L-methionine-dependent methyltransferase